MESLRQKYLKYYNRSKEQAANPGFQNNSPVKRLKSMKQKERPFDIDQ